MRRSDVIHRIEHVLVHNMDIEPVLAAEAAPSNSIKHKKVQIVQPLLRMDIKYGRIS